MYEPETGEKCLKKTEDAPIDWSKSAAQSVNKAAKRIKGSNTPTERLTCLIKEEVHDMHAPHVIRPAGRQKHPRTTARNVTQQKMSSLKTPTTGKLKLVPAGARSPILCPVYKVGSRGEHEDEDKLAMNAQKIAFCPYIW